MNKFTERMEKLEKALVQANIIDVPELEGTQKDAEGVAKAYVAPDANYAILNQKFGRLLIDEGKAFVDLVVDNSQALQLIFVDPVEAMKSSINAYDIEVTLSQTAEGEDPFATASNIAKAFNLGYDVVLQSIQLPSRVTSEQLRSMAMDGNFAQNYSNRVSKAFGNELYKMAMFASPASNADLDLDKGYNYVGNTAKGHPYRESFAGILHTIKKGYTSTKDGGSVTCTVGGKINTYDTANSKFKPILQVLEELVQVYPEDFNDSSEVKIMMSNADFLRYRIAIGKINSSTDKMESGNVKDYAGYEIIAMPYWKSIDKAVSVSSTDYYPGMVVMGRPKDMVLKINVAEIQENSQYEYKLRTYDALYNVSCVPGAIVQRMAIAHYYR